MEPHTYHKGTCRVLAECCDMLKTCTQNVPTETCLSVTVTHKVSEQYVGQRV